MAPILFIHGFPFDGSMWNHQKSAGFSMLAPNLPGFGPDPSSPPVNSSIEAYADSILQFIKAQPIRPIVAGLSMGGYVLLSILRTNPQEISAAILIDTRAEADSPEARANRLKSIEDVRQHGSASLINTMLPRLLAKSAAPAVIQETRAIMERQSAAAITAAQTAMANRRDQTDLLGRITVPTMIIVGTEDIITPPPAAQSMQSRSPGSKLVEVAGAGHMSPLEAPHAVNAAIADFAAGIPEIPQ